MFENKEYDRYEKLQYRVATVGIAATGIVATADNMLDGTPVPIEGIGGSLASTAVLTFAMYGLSKTIFGRKVE